MSARTTKLVVLAAVLALFAAPYYMAPFTITLLNYIGVYSFVALGLVLMTGIAGMVSFGQASFMGIAAYATAWASALMGYSPWLGLVLAIVVTCAVAAIVGLATLRLQGHFLSLSTIAWGLALYYTFGNIAGLGAYNGIGSIPPVSIGAFRLVDSGQIFYLIWGSLLLSFLAAHNLLDSRVGRAIRALRGGNTLVESLGINALHIRLVTFLIAALLAALSGWLYAHMSRFVSPTPFDVTMSIIFLMMAMIGGSGYLLGALVGAALITLLKNWIQDILPLIAPGSSGQLEIVVFSVLFIIFLQRARDGIVPYVAQWLPTPRQQKPLPAETLPRRAQPEKGGVLMTVEAASRNFGGLVAVNNVSFDVHANEILALIGPNGAGKTTMFNLITGTLRASAGHIVFAGKDITRASASMIARTGVARTFQHVKLRPRMSLIDNVLLGAYNRTRASLLTGALRLDRFEEHRARSEAMFQLERVGLGDRPYDLAGNLPLGNQRLLEIARALAADPVLLVLDEPAAGLRRQEKLKLTELLRTLRAEGLSILLVEHDMDFVMALVDRVVVMDFGCKLCEGAPETVCADARVQEAYLGGVA